eukprot:c27276_g1_i1.p1 GENE.c27276_g1_i1~~c27276_g1_i1.p1  ORF type:complete len:275 (+),score=47.59 c27276_g1_i1:38-862(+)
MATPRLLVVGGSGFIGRHVCRAALQRGAKVVSLSRRGAPSSLNEEPWMRHVDWQKGDAIDPATTAELLKDCQGVVHAVGRLIDDSAPGPISRVYRSVKQGTPFPPESLDETQTLEQINRDAALAVANVAANTPSSTSTKHVRSFVFVSSALLDTLSSSAPYIPTLMSRFMNTMVEVEDELSSYTADTLRASSVRLGVVYDDWIMPTHPLAVVSALVSAPSRFLPGSFPTVLPHPIHAHVAATCIVECALNPRYSGIIPFTQVTTIAESAGVPES